MSNRKYLGSSVLPVLALVLLTSAAAAPAQVSISIGVARLFVLMGTSTMRPIVVFPTGSYGPDWFSGGVFIGTGPWYHGSHGFYGHVDNRYDPASWLRRTYAGTWRSGVQPLPRKRGAGQPGPRR